MLYSFFGKFNNNYQSAIQLNTAFRNTDGWLLRNQTAFAYAIRLYSQFIDQFGTRRDSIWFQSIHKTTNTVRDIKNETRNDFPACSVTNIYKILRRKEIHKVYSFNHRKRPRQQIHHRYNYRKFKNILFPFQAINNLITKMNTIKKSKRNYCIYELKKQNLSSFLNLQMFSIFLM